MTPSWPRSRHDLAVIWLPAAMTAFRSLRESEPDGAALITAAVAALAAEPRPDTSTALGDTAFRRLRIARYRVLYELTPDAVRVMHVGQVFPY